MSRVRILVGVGGTALLVSLVVGLPLVEGAQGGHHVRLEGGEFVPREEIVGQGDTVTWTHADPGQVHSVTADDGSFDSHPGCGAFSRDRCMREGETFSFTFKKVGRFAYFSKLHGSYGGEGMSAAIVVVEKGTGVSSTTQPKKG
jgi:plastocyanin